MSGVTRHSLRLQVALNGAREHPAVPRTPEELVVDARAAVDGGAESLHLHPFDGRGRQTLAPGPCAEALRAVREACPDTPISLSTSAGIESTPERRYERIESWTELPDLVTANQGEDGIHNLCELLVDRGIGIEAGLLSLDDAETFVDSGLASDCERVLVEPLDSDPDDAVAHAEAIEQTLADGAIRLEQIHHGDGIASWAVNRRAVERGHGVRTGLEDTPVLPDGSQAAENRDLVAAAAAILDLE